MTDIVEDYTTGSYRYLSEDNSTDYTVVTNFWDHGGVKAADITWVSVDEVDVKSTEGRNLPKYHARKKRGELLPLTYFRQEKIGAQQFFATDMTYNPTGYRKLCLRRNADASQVFGPGLEMMQEFVAGYPTEYFVQAAAAKIYSSGWDALTFMAELRQTVAMFRNFVSNFAKNASSGKLENIWLEGRYGWRTLMYDVEDINKMLTNIDSKRSRFKESVGTTVKEVITTPTIWGLAEGGVVNLTRTDNIYIGVRGTVVADITPPDLAFNPITTAWELKTLSFVVDWLWNVGQFLEAMSFLTFSSEHYAAGGHQIDVIRQYTVDSVTPHTNWSFTCSGRADFFRSWTIRTPTQVSTNPLLQLRLDSLKVLDLVALATQALWRNPKLVALRRDIKSGSFQRSTAQYTE